MKIDVLSITEEQQDIQFEGKFSEDGSEYTYSFSGFVLKMDEDNYLLEGQVKYARSAVCHRCAEGFSKDNSLNVRVVASRVAPMLFMDANVEIDLNGIDSLNDEDTYPILGDVIDLCAILHEEMLIHPSTQVLCSDDCIGVEGTSFGDEEDDKPLDDRWKSLKGIVQ